MLLSHLMLLALWLWNYPDRPHSAQDRTLTPTDAVQQFINTVDSLRTTARIPGLAMVVLRDTTVVIARGLGLADIATGRPVDVDTPFDIASVSKPISAVTALRLVQDGLLDLDRPMRSYRGFAEFCADARASGGVFFGDFACTTDALTLRHVLSMTANGPVPGQRFLYNPPSYSWASRPLMEITGQPFSSLVDSLVLRPAGMANAARIHRSLPLPRHLADRLAVPYHVDSIGSFVASGPPAPQGDGAAGGVIASAMDLARFDQALMAGRLIDPALRTLMWTPGRSSDGTRLPYGLGWFLARVQGHDLAWHTGLWEQRYSALYLKILGNEPASRWTLILLANSDGLQWPTGLDKAVAERSPFVRAFLTLVGTSGALRTSGDTTPVPTGRTMSRGDSVLYTAMARAYHGGRELLDRHPHIAKHSVPLLEALFGEWRSGRYEAPELVGAFMHTQLGETSVPDVYAFFSAFAGLDSTATRTPSWAQLPDAMQSIVRSPDSKPQREPTETAALRDALVPSARTNARVLLRSSKTECERSELSNIDRQQRRTLDRSARTAGRLMTCRQNDHKGPLCAMHPGNRRPSR